MGGVKAHVVKPVGATGELPTILNVDGGGRILGNAGTHDWLVCEPVVGVNAAVFVERSSSSTRDALRDEGESYAAGVRTTSALNGTLQPGRRRSVRPRRDREHRRPGGAGRPLVRAAR